MELTPIQLHNAKMALRKSQLEITEGLVKSISPLLQTLRNNTGEENQFFGGTGHLDSEARNGAKVHLQLALDILVGERTELLKPIEHVGF